MKSSTGDYYTSLDHVRVLAAFMVFTWHFFHGTEAHALTAFPVAFLNQGHTGVSLFMALSGYLFAKLLDDRNIHYGLFIWSRVLRLAPLLIVVLILVGIKEYISGNDIIAYLKNISVGLLKPTFPNGGWSITVEIHFYLTLPFLLFLSSKFKYALVFLLAAIFILRIFLYQNVNNIEVLSYWTIVGRIDQFILGIIAFQFRSMLIGRHLVAAAVLLFYVIVMDIYHVGGGLMMNQYYPYADSIWTYWYTAEGLIYAILIAWYDNSFEHKNVGLSRFIASVGQYTYSVYLLHFFAVFWISGLINQYVFELSNPYITIFFSLIAFLIFLPVCYLSYRFIETPFLAYRVPYIVSRDQKESVGIHSS